MPKVAIVIPVYNKELTLARAIASARKQTLEDIEIIVVNDGSTDNSEAKILEAIGGDPRCKYIKQANAGVAHARNAGVLDHSTAQYVMCLDSDDAIQRGYLEGLVPYLDADRRLGIVYTKLFYIKPNGDSGLSPWPDEFDADAQLSGRNQIPTAALTRREVWERLGGQRQRYAPLGAGAEDADFWLRAVSYGFGARFVPLKKGQWFIYSWLSGIVSGNPEYTEVDYRRWSPWARDRTLVPTPCIYVRKDYWSNPARWYDTPSVSVIIPTSNAHIDLLDNALDSLDAQTFKNFEIIVVFDTTGDAWEAAREKGRLRYIANTWPYCIFTSTHESRQLARDVASKLEADMAGKSILDDLPLAPRPRGPAVARNAGLALARGPLLLYLDADDWLEPEAIKKMVSKFQVTRDIVYSDHIGVASVPEERLNDLDGEVLAYNSRKGTAFIHQSVSNYACELAMKQPTNPPYVICNISALVPRKWVKEVGGFDENIGSWEDVLLWWRLAWAGKCFSRIPEPLLVYRYNTGTMRELGRENAGNLLQYLREISDKVEKMGCGCGNNTKKPVISSKMEAVKNMSNPKVAVLKLSRGGTIEVNDEDLILIEYRPRSRGSRPRHGMNDFGGGQIFYGYRDEGDKFLVHKRDLETDEAHAMAKGLQPEFVRVVEEAVKVIEEEPEDLPEPEDFSDVWGEALDEDEDIEDISIFPEPSNVPDKVNNYNLKVSALKVDIHNADYILSKFEEYGIVTVQDLLDFDEEHENIGGISSIPRVGEKTREAFLQAAEEALEE